jgi:hypothetical protein
MAAAVARAVLAASVVTAAIGRAHALLAATVLAAAIGRARAVLVAAAAVVVVVRRDRLGAHAESKEHDDTEQYGFHGVPL